MTAVRGEGWNLGSTFGTWRPVTAGYGLLTTAGGGGQWTYVLEQQSAFWLGEGVECSAACSVEAPLILARFHYEV